MIEELQVTDLTGDGYESYRVGPTCSVPGCNRLCDSAPRVLGKNYWVRMPDETEHGCVIGLCYLHNEQFKTGQATVSYKEFYFYWEEGDEGAKLDPQPPAKKISAEYKPDHTAAENHDPVTCPTCKRPMPKPKVERDPEAKRTRTTWAVGVPKDSQEDGADTLDALLEAARDEMAKKGWEYGTAGTAKFFVLCHALSMFVIHADQVLGDS